MPELIGPLGPRGNSRPAARGLIRGQGYTAAAKALFDRMAVQPSGERKKLYHDLVSNGQDLGWWAKCDVLWLRAAHTEQASRLNLKGNDAFNLSPVNSPSFTVDRGGAGNGTSSYENTNFNPVVHGVNYTTNSAMLAVWSLTETNAGTYCDLGVRLSSLADQASLFARLDSVADATQRAQFRTNVDDTIAAGANVAIGSSLGFFAGNRESSTLMRGYRNGSRVVENAASTASAPHSAPLFLGALNQAGTPMFFSPRRYAFAAAGGQMSEQNVLDMQAAVAVYLAAVGAI